MSGWTIAWESSCSTRAWAQPCWSPRSRWRWSDAASRRGASASPARRSSARSPSSPGRPVAAPPPRPLPILRGLGLDMHPILPHLGVGLTAQARAPEWRAWNWIFALRPTPRLLTVLYLAGVGVGLAWLILGWWGLGWLIRRSTEPSPATLASTIRCPSRAGTDVPDSGSPPGSAVRS